MYSQFKNPKFYVVLGIDAVLIALSLLLSYLLRFDFAVPASFFQGMLEILPYALGIKLFILFCFGMHRGMWRYTDLRDSWRLFQASTVSTLLLVALITYMYSFQGYPRSVFLIDWLLTFLFTGGYRVWIRTFYRYRENYNVQTLLPLRIYSKRRKYGTNVLIIGAGDAGEKLLREIVENPGLAYTVVGFLDDDLGKKNRALHGVPVLGTVDELEHVIDRYAVQQIFIALPAAAGDQMRRVVGHCKRSGLAFKTLPALGEILEDNISVRDLRDVNYKDLLGRESVQLDTTSIEGYLGGKVVLVTGAGGSIGAELCRQIIRFAPRNLLLLEASEANLYAIQMEIAHEKGFDDFVPVLGHVQDKDLVAGIFRQYAPDVVFHAAAYKHVPLLEENPWQAVINNILGSHAVMQAAVAYGVQNFVVVSTDKAVAPTNVMGATKRMTELLMHTFDGQCATKFMAVRFGNVVGSSGSVIPLFERQIEHGGPVTVTHEDVTRFFMTIEEAAQLILQAGALGEGGEVFVLDMGTPIRIIDMARDLIRLMGKVPDVDISIEVVGLRPGEKLYEELITHGEGIVQAGHDKIMVLKPENESMIWQCDFQSRMEDVLDGLVQGAAKRDGQRIRELLQSVLPEYTPSTAKTVLWGTEKN